MPTATRRAGVILGLILLAALLGPTAPAARAAPAEGPSLVEQDDPLFGVNFIPPEEPLMSMAWDAGARVARIQINWQDHPEYHRVTGFDWLYKEMEERDPPMYIDEWEKTTRANLSHKKWLQEYECEFLGTGDTFVEGQVLEGLLNNISEDFYRLYNNRMYVWKDPDPTTNYFIAADVALGRERDYSAFHVLDLHTGEQVAEFYSNTTPVNEFARILYEQGTRYNTAPVMIERNTIGNNLIDYLWDQLEYDNVWFDEKGLP